MEPSDPRRVSPSQLRDLLLIALTLGAVTYWGLTTSGDDTPQPQPAAAASTESAQPTTTTTVARCHESSAAETDLLALMFNSDATTNPTDPNATISVTLTGGVVAAYHHPNRNIIVLFAGEPDTWSTNVWALNGHALGTTDATIFTVHRPTSDRQPPTPVSDALAAIEPCL